MVKKAVVRAGVLALLGVAASGAVAQSTGFYVKGEAGYSASRDIGFKNSDPATSPLSAGFTLKDKDQAALFGGGIGYRFSPSLRVDLSATRRGTYDFSDRDDATPGLAPAYKGSIKSTAYMLTGYYDLPKMSVLTPFVSLGIGLARNRISDVRFSDPAVPVAGFLSSKSNNELAWSVGLGAALEVSRNAAVEVGYRYIDLGEVKTGDGSVTVPGVAAITGIKDGKLRSNEVSVGLRYQF